MSEKRGLRASIRTIKATLLQRSGYYKKRYLRQFPNAKDAVFIWIPKNGGTSMYRTLKPLGMQYLTHETQIKHYFSNKGMVSFGPLNYSYLVESGLVSQSFHQSAFKFAISRNPYDRAVSSYFYFRDKAIVSRRAM